MTNDLMEKGRKFRALHEGPDIFVMPNAWDAGSAMLLAAAGCQAIGTTSGGVNWSRGCQDYVYHTPAEVMLEAYGDIAAAVGLPVSGDLENGYGESPVVVARTIRQSVEQGMVGGSIEDSTADPEKPLYDIDLAVERIAAAREAADATGVSYSLTARAETFYAGLDDPFGEAVRRANRYREAGADCIFVPGLVGADAIGGFVREVSAPVSVVMGLVGEPLTVADLGALGVRRISTGASIARAALATVRNAAREIMGQGSFGYAAAAIPDAEINAFFGPPTAAD